MARWELERLTIDGVDCPFREAFLIHGGIHPETINPVDGHWDVEVHEESLPDILRVGDEKEFAVSFKTKGDGTTLQGAVIHHRPEPHHMYVDRYDLDGVGALTTDEA